MKLTIELVPEGSWYSNVRSNVTQEEWDLIRRPCYRQANYRCEICGGVGSKWPVECHEKWNYDDTTHIQKLMGFIALCPACHQVKHIGLSQIRGLYDETRQHLANVNGIKVKKAEKYIRECFAVWERRSLETWTVDLSYINREPAPIRRKR